MRIVHLPLDSRPCNVLFPLQLAEWCGHTCVTPAKEEMDFFAQAASFEASRGFLLREAPQADAMVVSADHLCYGSLLASRQDDVSADKALERLELLVKLHQEYPEIPIYVYSVIMRSSISTLYAGDLDAYNAMTEYSVYSDRAAQTGAAEDALKAQNAKDRLPRAVLTRYEKARARNHAVNCRCVELAAQGVICSLTLLQEDAQVYGFHKGEQRALLKRCAETSTGNVWLHNGADEGGALTVMKAIARKHAPLKIAVKYLGWEHADFVACYEDRPFDENVVDSAAYAGLTVDSESQDVLAVCCPPDGIQTDWPKKEHEEGLKRQAEEIAAMCSAGKNVYLLDVTRANGGSPALLRYLWERMPQLPLAGYSAWNTASNALGTAIAQMMSDRTAGKTNRCFFWERVLDDLVYQGVVRAELNDVLTAAGEDPFRLKDQRGAEKLLERLMKNCVESEPAYALIPPYRVSLPWNRTFEAELRLEQTEEGALR